MLSSNLQVDHFFKDSFF